MNSRFSKIKKKNKFIFIVRLEIEIKTRKIKLNFFLNLKSPRIIIFRCAKLSLNKYNNNKIKK